MNRQTDRQERDQNFLERLTGCRPGKPTMAGYERKIQESVSCSVQRAGCLHWFSVDADASGSNASEGMESKQAENKCFLLQCPYTGIQQKVLPK